MLFADNELSLVHDSGARLTFCALDALRHVSATPDDTLKVAPSAEWAEARRDCAFIGNNVKQFDWTFTTRHRGSTVGLVTEPTTERIDLERLKAREPIVCFEEVALFEDELADHGCAALDVKLRAMASGVFVLQRFHLRVDHVLSRFVDTRVHWRADCPSYLLREWSVREQRHKHMTDEQRQLVLQPAQLWSLLPEVELVCERLNIPS